MRRPLIIAVAATVAFFTLQAAYWPLVVTPGVKLYFWQMHWAAEIGYRVGAPVVGAILFSPLSGMTQHVVAIGMSVTWAAAVAWVASVGIHNFHHTPEKPAARAASPVTPAVAIPTAPDAAAQTPAQLARSAARPSAPSD